MKSMTDILPLDGLALHWSWQSIAICAVGVPLLAAFASWTISYLRSPLKRYPGPALAGCTNLWRFLSVWSGNYHLILQKLHKKYGPVVRIGPNLLDLDYPELIKTIYGTDDDWRKTAFYASNGVLVNGHIVYNMFSTPDPAEHARMKRPVAKYYSTSGVLSLEPHMDEILNDFCDQLERRFTKGSDSGKNCNLGQWVAYCAWDLITSISVSRPYGYMEHGYDFDNSLKDLDKAMDYFSIVGQIPFLDSFLDKNPIVRLGPPNMTNSVIAALGFIQARAQGKDKNFNPHVPDLLHRFMESKAAYPDIVDDNTLFGYMLAPLVAGADTTAIAIRAVIYYMLKDPAVHRKLEEEILAADFSDDEPIPYNTARALPYLDAVIREAMRLHPSVPMPLERTVPASGLALPDGTRVPPGTAVGLSPYIVLRNAARFGADAAAFRPERWLRGPREPQPAFDERLRGMRAVADLTFGGGARICLGRHLALMEVYKMLGTLVRRFEMELAEPGREWTVVGRWFFRQTDIVCRLRRRR